MSEVRMGELLRTVKDPPEAWVRAAQELPAVQRWVDEIEAQAQEDEEFRRAVDADIERALESAGYEPTPQLLAAWRARREA
jgi:hypothetical protein